MLAWNKPAARRYWWNLKHHWGLTPELLDLKMVEQFGACAICKQHFEDTPHVDHDHASGSIRGLLCKQCNLMIGFARESPDTLVSGSNYIKHWRFK